MSNSTAHILTELAAASRVRSDSLRTDPHSIRFCHFTTAHDALKSRSFHRQCLPLAKAGFDVRYVSPAPVEGLHDGIQFVRLARKTSSVASLRRQASLLRCLLRLDADIYHFQDPQLLPLAFLLKLLSQKHVVYDAYEDFPSMAAQKRSIPHSLRPFAASGIALLENIAARCFDAILTADPRTMKRFAHTGDSRKIVFYNFPNLDYFPAPGGTEKKFDVVYRGGLSERAGTYTLLDALSLLAKGGQRPRALFLGYWDDDAAARALRERVARLGLEQSVCIRGRIPHEAMSAALSEARIGISPLEDTPKFRLNIPVKVFEYWACGLPVIASDLPPARPFLEMAGAGISFAPGDAAALARAISLLMNQPGAACQMGLRGRAIVEKRLHNGAEARKLAALCRALVRLRCTADARSTRHA